MDEMMITLQTGDQQMDLKVPVFVSVGELIDMLSAALGISAGPENKIQAEPLGRILRNDRTLEEEEVTQGSLLTLL
jgi:uncharacterized ubiquitin-like protein YukD